MAHERLPLLLRCAGRHCGQLVPVPFAAMQSPATMRQALARADRDDGGWRLSDFRLAVELEGAASTAIAPLCPRCYARAARGVLSAVTHPIVHG